MDYTLFLVLAPLSAGCLIAAIRAVWPYRSKPISKAILAYFAFVCGLLLSNTAELLSPSTSTTLFFAQANYVFTSGLVVCWLAFALSFSGYERMVGTRWIYIPLSIPGVLAVVAAFTSQIHGYFWTEITFFPANGYLTMSGDYGILFWLYGTYHYILLLTGTALIVTSPSIRRHLYRRQSLICAIGAILPMIANLTYVFRLLPGVTKDFTSVSYALAGLAFYVGVHRYSLLRIMPITDSEILKDVNGSVLVLDHDGLMLEANARARRELQLPPKFEGSHFSVSPVASELLSGRRIDRRSNFETAIGLPESGDSAAIDDATGTPVMHSYEIWIRPVLQRTGRHTTTVITIFDITEYVSLIEERDRAIRELRARRNELSELQIKLLDQDRLATTGQLAAGLMHEINNPLAFLGSSFRAVKRQLSELLEDPEATTLDSDTRAELSSEVDSIAQDFDVGYRRIADVVRNLLDLSRPRQDAESHDIEVKSILETSLSLARPVIGNRVTVVREVEELPLIKGNRGELCGAVLNLLLNAARALEESNLGESGRIVVRAAADCDTVRCEIEDNGPGVPIENAERVFDPFVSFRAKPGSGLGLSISRDIIEKRHEGRLFLHKERTLPDRSVTDAAAGRSSRFVIQLPIDARRAVKLTPQSIGHTIP